MVCHQSHQIRGMHFYEVLQVPIFPHLRVLRSYLFGFGMNQAFPGPANIQHLNMFLQW